MSVHLDGIPQTSSKNFKPDVELELGKLLRAYGLKRDIGKREIECLLRFNNYYANQINVNTSIKSKDIFLSNLINTSPDKKDICNLYIQVIEQNLVEPYRVCRRLFYLS